MKKFIHYTFELFINPPLGIICLLLSSLFFKLDDFGWEHNIEILQNNMGDRLDNFAEKLVDLKWKMHKWAYSEK